MTDAARPDGTDDGAGNSTARAGERVGAYVLVKEIGRGAAATVYLAEDVRHRRSVALKLLHADASSALGGDRFRREIEVVAQLQHPHILPLHDSGELAGQLYYVMPLVTGETLRDRIGREGALPLAQVRRITNDVAAALDYAHRRGVVHRDVKPANILVDDEHAMVADFGIAHRPLDESSDQLTATGMIIGTPTYMSPEQSTGSREIDARTDVYALGCVVFEMLTGEPPYRGPGISALVVKHLQAPVPSAHALRTELPPRVDEVLRTALAKDPAERFASTRELATALGDAIDTLGTRRTGTSGVPENDAPLPPRALPPRMRITAAAAVLVALVAIAAGLWRCAAARDTGPPSVAVLPFTNMSGNPADEYFSDGITEELTGALADLGGIRVTARTTAFGYKGRNVDLRRIARELDVRHIVEGSVRRERDSVRVVATLIDVATGERLMREPFNRPFSSVLGLQMELAAKIAEKLQRSLQGADRSRLALRHSKVPGAFDAYLRGRYLFDQRAPDSLLKATEYFKKAIDLDPTYARAHAGLADTYSILAWLGEGEPRGLFEQARGAAENARRLGPEVAESHVSQGIIHAFGNWKWADANDEFVRAIEIDPELTSAWYFRTWPLVAQNRLDSALAVLKRAERLDPNSIITKARVATLYVWMDSLLQAETVARSTLARDPMHVVGRVVLARVLSEGGHHDSAVAALPSDTVRLPANEAGIAGVVYARAGRDSAARSFIQRLSARPVVPYDGIAKIYAALGDRDLALSAMEKALAQRTIGMIFIGVEPMFDDLRNEPRFRQVLATVGAVERRRRVDR